MQSLFLIWRVVKSHYRIIIVGTGFGGQSAAIQLLKKGITDFVMLERRDFVGGTWVQNRYPGAAVDVQSPLYCLSDEPYDWSRMFVEQAELEDYTQHVFDKYQLHKKSFTGKTVTHSRWDSSTNRWQLTINETEQVSAQFVINATGPLSMPVIPDFPGKESFSGPSFHTNQWDHSVDLKGKNVAVIGSGASAAQVIPSIVGKVKHLHVFQRTPHWVLSRPDHPFSPWQRSLLKHKWISKWLRWMIYLALEFRILGFKYSSKILDYLGTVPAKKQLEKQVPYPELRAKLTPDYTIGCKRILVSNTLLPALSRANVTLHDRQDGIKHIQGNGILTTQDRVAEVDVIVYATGFDATDGLISYPVVGRNKRQLGDVWHAYPRAYLGTCVPDFPNFFIVTGPNTGIGHTSAIFMIESQMRYIMQCIQRVLRTGMHSIEVTENAEQDYTSKIHQEMQKTVWQTGGCHSWYKSREGKVIAMFPGFSFNFRRLCKVFKAQHHLIK